MTGGLFGSHSFASSILKLVKNKRTIFPSGGLKFHEQEALGGYFNGQLGVKNVPLDDPRSLVLLQIDRKFKLIIIISWTPCVGGQLPQMDT